VSAYPDAEAIALVGAAAARAELPVPAVLEDFGMSITPTLLSMYKSLINPGWRTLDVLENTEQTIHTVVRRRNPGAAPSRPELPSRLQRPPDFDLYVPAAAVPAGDRHHQRSRRALRRRHRHDQTQCMLDGADGCTIAVRTKSLAGAPAG